MTARQQKRWTIRELNDLRQYADEGLSMRRTAHWMGRTIGAVFAAAHRYGVHFRDSGGAPYDNMNSAKRERKRSSEDIRRQNRERMRRWRRNRKMREAAD